MWIYLLQIILILCAPLLVGKIGYRPWKLRICGTHSMKLCRSKTVDYNAVYCFMAMLVLLLVIGFRTENLGLYDVKTVYFPTFDAVSDMTMKEIIAEYPFIRGNLFQILTKIYTNFSSNKYIWLFLCSIPYLAAMCHTIRKYANNVYVCAFAFYLICSTRIYQTNFFLVRHSIAMAVLILAFDAIVDKRPVKFILLVLVASLFHTTAIAFLIAYPLARIKPSWKQLVLIVAAFYVIIYMSSGVMSTIFSLLGSENYYSAFETRGGFDSFTLAIICGVLLAAAFLLNLKNKSDNDLDKITINMLMVGTILMGAATMVGEFYRIGYFFMTVSFVGLGNIISKEKTTWLRWGVYAFLMAFTFIYMYRGFEPNLLVPYESWLFN